MYQPQYQSQTLFQHNIPNNLSSVRAKRRFSEDSDSKRTKVTTPQKDVSKEEYPKFHHPDGGFIQFTPNGTIRTLVINNEEVTHVQPHTSPEKFDLRQISHGIDGYKLNSFSPTTSVESYMLKGYSNVQYSDFNSYDCDSDLDDDDDMDCN